ncbi:hypothetical protein AB0N05_01815 [Nocardia sp. NPDC051030]|uniref:hypothetical protein n=1 Tax=Nocardia sp. NPDC051030 TaxID=3155162 RepID=UPI003449ED9F
MAVLAVMDWEETKADYDAIIAEMGVTGKPAPGIALHVAGSTETGMRIIELWDDAAGFESFVTDTLLPTARAAGIVTTPTYTTIPILNLFAPRLDEVAKLAAGFAE